MVPFSVPRNGENLQNSAKISESLRFSSVCPLRIVPLTFLSSCKVDQPSKLCRHALPTAASKAAAISAPWWPSSNSAIPAFLSRMRHHLRNNRIGSPSMWVWPELVFGGSPLSPIAIGGPFAQANPLPSPPSPSLFPPTPLGSFCKVPGGGGPSWWGGGVLGRKGLEGGGVQAALGARPTSGGTRQKQSL